MNRIIFLITFVVVGIGTTYYFSIPNEEEAPGFINPVDVDPDMVAEDLQNKGIGHRTGNFSFLNQRGETITQDEVKGKVHVVEYFFSTCGSICPKMNKQLLRVNKEFKDNSNFKILSFTVDPEVDSVEQLNSYSKSLGVKGLNWHFLTGERDDLYQLARRSYFVLKPAEAKNQGDAGGDFIHTNNFVLIDQLGRIRKYYDGTSSTEVGQMIKDIRVVLKEENKEE